LGKAVGKPFTKGFPDHQCYACAEGTLAELFLIGARRTFLKVPTAFPELFNKREMRGPGRYSYDFPRIGGLGSVSQAQRDRAYDRRRAGLGLGARPAVLVISLLIAQLAYGGSIHRQYTLDKSYIYSLSNQVKIVDTYYVSHETFNTTHRCGGTSPGRGYGRKF
jgi:hypothetical protein